MEQQRYRPPERKSLIKKYGRYVLLALGLISSEAAPIAIQSQQNGDKYWYVPFGNFIPESNSAKSPGNEFSPINPEYPLRGPATVSENAFVAILKQGNSPMSPQTARDVYRMIVGKGLNPSPFLAMFQEESNLGTTGFSGKIENPGNMRPWWDTSGPPPPHLSVYEADGNGKFVDFNGYWDGHDGWYHGFDAWTNDAISIMDDRNADGDHAYTDANGNPITTVPQIVKVFAPDSDGNVDEQYTANVEQFMSNYNQMSRDIADGKLTTDGGVPFTAVAGDLDIKKFAGSDGRPNRGNTF